MKKKRLKSRYNPNEYMSPYPNGPKKPGIYVLYIDWPEFNRSYIPIYALTYGAKRHLDILLEGLEYEIVEDPKLMKLVDDGRWLVAENGIRVRCSRLQEILDHEDFPEEEAWEMEERHVRSIKAFRQEKVNIPRKGFEPDTTDATDEGDNSSVVRVKKIKREVKRAPRELPTGMISVAEIAESLNMLPREARARLRKAEVEKPDNGWVWSKTEAEKIKKLIASS